MPLSPLITSWLPTTTPGPYKSPSYIHLTHPPIQPHDYPSPTLKTTSQPALSIKTISYAIFYPAETPKKGSMGVYWFPEPTAEFALGYEKFLGKRGVKWIFQALRFIVGRLKIPAYQNLPLLPPNSGVKRPLVIFSHGLAGTRHTYTQFCTALASEGNVVLAIEHRDGSAPAVVIPSTEAGIKDSIMHYVKKDELQWKDGEDTSLEHFRTLQLEMRIREVYEVYQGFKDQVEGTPDVLRERVSISGVKEEETQALLASFRDTIDFDDLTLTGHSFGGGTMMQLLQNSSPDQNHLPNLPVKRVIALDPWLDPLPTPAASSSGNPTMPPLLVVNSPGFTIWPAHFARLSKMVSEAKGSLMTILGTNHQSFSDFPLLSPGSPYVASGYLNTIHELVNAFINGRLSEAEHIKGKTPDQGEFERGPDGKMVGDLGRVVLHQLGKDTAAKAAI